jgi:hypothetical protein
MIAGLLLAVGWALATSGAVDRAGGDQQPLLLDDPCPPTPSRRD